jgi:hypothetical protein
MALVVTEHGDFTGRVFEVPNADISKRRKGTQCSGERADGVVPDSHGGTAVEDYNDLQPWFRRGGEPRDEYTGTGVVLDCGVDVEALADAGEPGTAQRAQCAADVEGIRKGGGTADVRSFTRNNVSAGLVLKPYRDSGLLGWVRRVLGRCARCEGSCVTLALFPALCGVVCDTGGRATCVPRVSVRPGRCEEDGVEKFVDVDVTDYLSESH